MVLSAISNEPGSPTASLPALCRPAGAADTAGALRLVGRIWGGEDYVPRVWGEWLRDEQGVLAVAQQGTRIAGLGHLADLGLGEAWLEGLRVDPEEQGRGIGSHLHDYFVARWLELRLPTIRLVTHAERIQVHAMCARTGFEAVAEVQFHRAASEAGAHAFKASAPDSPAAWERLQRSGTQRHSRGLFDLGWEFCELRPERLAASVGLGMWGWRDQEGWLVARRPSEAGDSEFTLGAAWAADMAGLLRDSRALAHSLGAAEIHWLAPTDPEVLSALQTAGFESDGPADQFTVFERRKPAGGG